MQVLKVNGILFKQGIPLYKLTDLNNEPIKGYANENKLFQQTNMKIVYSSLTRF